MCEQNMVSLPYKLAPLDVGTVNVTFTVSINHSRTNRVLPVFSPKAKLMSHYMDLLS